MGDRDVKVGTRRARAIPLAAIGGALFFGALLVRDWRKPKCGAVIYATTGPHEPTTPGRNPSPADPAPGVQPSLFYERVSNHGIATGLLTLS